MSTRFVLLAILSLIALANTQYAGSTETESLVVIDAGGGFRVGQPNRAQAEAIIVNGGFTNLAAQAQNIKILLDARWASRGSGPFSVTVNRHAHTSHALDNSRFSSIYFKYLGYYVTAVQVTVPSGTSLTSAPIHSPHQESGSLRVYSAGGDFQVGQPNHDVAKGIIVNGTSGANMSGAAQTIKNLLDARLATGGSGRFSVTVNHHHHTSYALDNSRFASIYCKHEASGFYVTAVQI